MGRAMVLSFFIVFCVSFSISLWYEINSYYISGYYTNPSDASSWNAGVNHPLFSMTVRPLIGGYVFRDADNNVANYSSTSSYNSTMQNVAAYKPAPLGLSDIFGFFSWVITGIKLIINAFFMPLFGFPTLMESFWIPNFITQPFGGLLFILEILGLYEFTTGRDPFK